MSEVKVTLKDGSVKEFAAGTSYLEIAKSLNQKLGKQALLAVVDGVNKDLSDTIEKDAAVEFVTAIPLKKMLPLNLLPPTPKKACMPSAIPRPM